MMLHDILPAVLRMLRAPGCEHITIARDGEHAYQVRFQPDKSIERGWRSEGRRWMCGTEIAPIRGTKHGHVGWSMWSIHLGWQVESIIATDWEIIDPPRERAKSLFENAGPDRTIRPSLDSSAVCPRCQLRDELIRVSNIVTSKAVATPFLRCKRCNLTFEST